MEFSGVLWSSVDYCGLPNFQLNFPGILIPTVEAVEVPGICWAGDNSKWMPVSASAFASAPVLFSAPWISRIREHGPSGPPASFGWTTSCTSDWHQIINVVGIIWSLDWNTVNILAKIGGGAMAPVALPLPLPLNNKLHAWLTYVKATNQGDDNLERHVLFCTIKVRPQSYGSYPLWHPFSGKAMAPVALPLPRALNNKLHAWLTDVKATNQGDLMMKNHCKH